MSNQTKYLVCNIISIICAVWFISTGWVWAYFANIFISYPVAIVGLILWKVGRKAENKLLNKIAAWLLLTGLVLSLSFLVFVL